MSPNTDAYWVGAFAMACARALHKLETAPRSRWPEGVGNELSAVLEAFAESPVLDDGLRQELAPYWEPRKESDGHHDVV